MSIIFYSMSGCHFCDKAKDLLRNEIASGEVVIKPASMAPAGVNGFPYFENPVNRLSHTGYPGDKQTLYNKLRVGVTEGYRDTGYRRSMTQMNHMGSSINGRCLKCGLYKA